MKKDTYMHYDESIYDKIYNLSQKHDRWDVMILNNTWKNTLGKV